MRIYQLRSASSFSIEKVVDHFNGRSPSNVPTSSKSPFSMILPPPNVTGNLHLGHALTVVMEDTICRYQRRNGRSVEWYPGFDHAGIATQSVVERQIYKEKGLLRSQLTRDEFLRHCNEWKDERINTITSQLKLTGASLNWDNCYYTMDDKFSSAVSTAFCRLYSDGFIFRKKKLINWCPTLQSAISDQEVDRIIIEGKTSVIPSITPSLKQPVEVGILHLIRYKIVNPSSGDPEYLEVGTTRPETLFADMALAINPFDEKWNKFIGRQVYHPLVDKILPIIPDESVKIDKGTGILKVTPSHDFIDYEIAQNHTDIFGHEYLSCIDEEGKLINAEKFNGMDRLIAKPKIIEELKARKAYGGVLKQDKTPIPICSRTGDFIEPMIKEQWFMECKDMNQKVLQNIESGQIGIFPDGNKQKLIDWLNYSEPWCLSRQLVWGHQIPAYRDSDGRWVVSEKPVPEMERDTDVLDTWFSSALIPLVVHGWPNLKLPENSLPISLMETGHDIIGFWVARMLILCQHLNNQLPFNKILLHGLVRDSSGRKMSKSLGNVIDPLDIIDGISLNSMVKRLRDSNLSEAEINLAEKDLRHRFSDGISGVGPDALRFGLLRHDLNSEDINVSIVESSQEGYRFCNKLWNLLNYAEIVFSKASADDTAEKSKNIVDLWILSKLQSTLKNVHELMDANNDCAAASPHLAFAVLKDFLLHDLCDVYLETTKTAINSTIADELTRQKEVSQTLQKVLQLSFAALEPFLPFVATYLGDKLPGKKFDTVDLSEEMKLLARNIEAESAMNFSMSIVNAIRSLRFALEIPKKYQLIGSLHDIECSPVSSVLNDLANLKLRELDNKKAVPVSVAGHKCSLYVQVEESQREHVIKHLQQQLDKAVHRNNLMTEAWKTNQAFLTKLENEPKTKSTAIKKAIRKVKSAESSMMFAQQEIGRIEELLKKIQ